MKYVAYDMPIWVKLAKIAREKTNECQREKETKDVDRWWGGLG